MLFKAKRAQGGSGTVSLIRVHPCSSVVNEKAEPKIARRLKFIRDHSPVNVDAPFNRLYAIELLALITESISHKVHRGHKHQDS